MAFTPGSGAVISFTVQGADASQRQIRLLASAIDGAGGSARTALKELAAFAGVGLGFTAMAHQVLDAQREFDKLNASLITATGSTAQAKEAFAALQAFASTTPYSVQEATEAFIKMRNLGLDPSERALRSYGNTAAAMGKDLTQMVEAVADASTGEFERLKEFGITAKQNGDQVALTFKGMTATIGNNAKDIQGYLRNLGEVDFAGGMELRAATLDGAISNLGDTWQNFLRTVSQSGAGDGAREGVTQLSAAINDLGRYIDAISEKMEKEGKTASESGLLHSTLSTVFETLAHVGVDVAYIFDELGIRLAGLAAQAKAVATGDFASVAMLNAQINKDVKEAQRVADARTKALVAASDKSQAAQDAETANLKKNSADRLAQHQVELSSEEKRTNALNELLEVRKRLLGINPQDQADMKKIQVAFDTGAISLAEYTRLKSLLEQQTRMNSQAYKDEQKSIDASTESIKQRVAAQVLLNQREKEHIDFLKNSGQIDDSEAIRQAAAVDVRELKQQKQALEDQLALAKRKVDNQKEQITLSGQIGEITTKINNRQLKEEEDLFLIEQQRYRLAANNYADLLEAAQAESKSQQDQVRDQQDYIDQLGMTQKQMAELTASRLRDQAARLEEKADLFELIDASGRLSEEYRKQAEALRSRAVSTVYAEQLKEEQQFWGDVERVAHDTFVSIADGGKSAFTRLKESAKNIFFEWLYQMTLKKWVINIGASADGPAAVAGLQSGSSLLTQGGSILGTASNLYSLATGGMTIGGGLGTGFMGSLAGGLNGAGVGSGLTSSLGLSIGNSIADVVGPQIAGALSTGLGAIATALPWVGGALAVVSLAKAAFGHGDREYTSSTLNGALGAGGFSGGIDNGWKEKGGWFSSDRTGFQHVDANAEMVTSLSTAYQTLKDATGAYAAVLGLNADSIANRTQTISIALGKDEAANQKAIADFFVSVGNQMAREIAPDLDTFTKAGESASATLQRLASDLQGTDQVAQLLGMSGAQLFGAAGMASVGAREQLIDAAGGLQVLAQQAQVFNQNFLTDAERLAPVAAALDKGLAALGLTTVPTTRDEFKALVQDMISSGAAATASGASQLAAVLSYSEAFALVHPQIDAAAEAAQQAATALQAMKDAASTMFAGVNDAYSALQKVVGREKSAIQASVDTHTAAFNKLQSLSQALHSTLDSFKSPEQLVYQRAMAQAEIRTDLAITKAGGTLSDAQTESLRKALSVVTQDASSQYSSYADYMRDNLRTQSDIAQLAGLTDDSLSVEQRSLDALKDQLTRLDAIVANGQAQIDALNGQSIATLSLAQAMAALQSSIGSAKANPVVAGTSTLAGFYQDLLGRAPDQAGLQYWQGVLASGESLDAIRKGFMNSDEYKDHQRKLGIPGFANGGDHVGGLRFVGEKGIELESTGASRIHSTQAIINALRNPSGANEALVAEVRALRTEVAALKSAVSRTADATERTAGSTGQLAEQIDNVTDGGNAMRSDVFGVVRTKEVV